MSNINKSVTEITLWACKSRFLLSLITFHICCALKEKPEAGTTPRLSPARPPGAIEWKNFCLKLATFQHTINIDYSQNKIDVFDTLIYLLFKLFFLLFITRECNNLNLITQSTRSHDMMDLQIIVSKNY